MTLYQLGKYNTKTDLSQQSSEIRDFIIVNHDYKSIRQLIEKYKELEEESVIILKKAILAGYWDSHYGFGWNNENEIEFWELVYSKSKNSGVAILTLAESYRGHKVKSLMEVIEMYVKAIEINSEHYYSIQPEDFEIIRKDEKWKFKFIDIELKLLEKQWDIDEFREELPYISRQFNGDKKLVEYKTEKINEIIKRKATNNV